jgi:hypothetical protein
MQGKGCFPQGNIFLVTGYRHRLPQRTCPPVSFSSSKLEVMEFYPKKMFEEGLASVMVAHLNVPRSQTKFLLSISIMLSQMLQKNWAFRSYYFTDALNSGK